MMNRDEFNSKVFIRAEQIKKERTYKKTRLLKVSSLCLSFVFIVCTLVFTVYNQIAVIPAESNNSTVTAGRSSSTDMSADSPDISKEIPDWYSPGSLDITTLTYSKNILNNVSVNNCNTPFMFLTVENKTANKTINLSPESIMEVPNGDINFIRVNPSTAGDKYSNCSYVYYNAKTSKYFALDNELKEIIKEKLPDAKIESLQIKIFNTSNQKVVFDLNEGDSENSETKCYVYDFNNENLKEVSTDLDTSGGSKYSSDFRYKYYFTYTNENPELCDVWILDIQSEDMMPKQINTIGSFDPLGFGADNKVFAYLIPNENNEWWTPEYLECNWIVYNIAAEYSLKGQGRIINYYDNDNYVIVETTEGIKIYDTRNGNEVTNTSEVPAGALNEVKYNSTAVVDNRIVKTITLEPLFTDGESIVISNDVSTGTDCGDYIYTYSHGNNYVEVFSKIDGEKFKIEIDDKFVNEASSLEGNGYHADYSISVSSDRTQLLLYYYKAENYN